MKCFADHRLTPTFLRRIHNANLEGLSIRNMAQEYGLDAQHMSKKLKAWRVANGLASPTSLIKLDRAALKSAGRSTIRAAIN